MRELAPPDFFALLHKDSALTPQERKRLLAPQRNPAKPRGHAWTPGTGPAGETCGSCAHLSRVRLAKTYLKCGRVRENWTHGPATDVRARDPACKQWEAKP